jgi:hypothetical protein
MLREVRAIVDGLILLSPHCTALTLLFVAAIARAAAQ